MGHPSVRFVLPPLFVLALAGGSGGCAPPPEPADLVLRGGKVVTMDPARPQARALAARAGRIVAVGNDEEIARFVGPSTHVVDLEGRLAIPGFIESHGHLTSLGRLRMALDLRDARSWDEVVRRVRETAADLAPGEWIFGRGWHQEKWSHPVSHTSGGYPTNEDLNEAAPRNPVLLEHASGHAAIGNSAALDRGGFRTASPDPPGGRIVRDPAGRPTGAVLETAADRLFEVMQRDRAARPATDVEAESLRALDLAQRECLEKGVTSFQDAGAPFETIERMRRLAEAGQLRIRIWVMVQEPNEALRRGLDAIRIRNAGDHHLTVGAIKKVMDGALGSRGAWLLEPYADDPKTTGLNTEAVPDLEEAARIAVEHRLQLCVHAIGDRANRETLDLYERVLGRESAGRGLRWRIEHAQHLSPADVPRFARLGVIAAIQGVHCTSDGPWVPTRIGARRAEDGAYVWRKLLASGAILANGTDTPVEDVDPIANFHASVTRRMNDGKAFYAAERMTRFEALRSYTFDAAYAAFEEHLKGSLEVGKLADVVVLSRDILTVPEDQIPGTAVVYTIVGGKVLHAGAVQ